jgi:DNA modification methylase
VGLALNEVHEMDCVQGLKRLEPGSVDLAFADPPFNIGYKYDVYDDRRQADEYLEWCREWISGLHRALKPNGTFWLAIGDEFAAELKVLSQRDLGFHCRSWVIWYYTFGVNCVKGFSRSHTHLFHFVKDPADFTFHDENPAVRVPSARQLVYADARANPRGRLPDNTWILRPQDVPGGFAADQDVWYYPRVAGTFKEREGFHGCQMPEQLLGRIIRSCSSPLEVVFDPFTGSGTTLAVAKKLGRRWLGFELSPEYARRARQRLDAARGGDPLDGAVDPLHSAPSTAVGKRRRDVLGTEVPGTAARPQKRQRISQDQAEFRARIAEAYRKVAEQGTVDQLLTHPELNAAFGEACRQQRLPGNIVIWNRTLVALRKQSKLPRGESRRPPRISLKDMDPYAYASEIAMQQLRVDFAMTLDEIFCDPQLATRFDQLAASLAPGYSASEYRWAALSLRKHAKTWKVSAQNEFADWLTRDLPKAVRLSRRDWSEHGEGGVYVLQNRARQTAYVGHAYHLGNRQQAIVDNPTWQKLDLVSVRLLPQATPAYGLQAILVHRLQPLWNSRMLQIRVEELAVRYLMKEARPAT